MYDGFIKYNADCVVTVSLLIGIMIVANSKNVKSSSKVYLL